MKVPHADRVRIDERKVRGYLLSQSHPVGRFKARVFAALGFAEVGAAPFMAEMRRIAATGGVAEVEDTAFGRKHTVPGDLTGPVGSARVLTVWIQELGREDAERIGGRGRT